MSTPLAATALNLGCAGNGLMLIEVQCFYLALLIGRLVCLISPIVASSLCCDKTFAVTPRSV
ncbi:hypothetical protein, partial [Bradyrhizobium sp. SZCCHNRI1003]|uniref:hypothetical protein n=1 Tax=Bradyrhizobium sp. SZCCHNRI1003 TaxID=3057275 RepID=UPI00291618B5